MSSLLATLRKVSGILSFALGFFIGVLGLCGTAVYLWLWFRGDHLRSHDRQVWLLCVAASGFGIALVWAGIVLLRVRSPGAAETRTFGLVTTGPQRRVSANHGLRNTLVWLALGAEIILFTLPGDPAAKTWQALLGMGLLYLGLQATFLCHELGHLGVAALFGFDLQKIQVGTGPPLARLKLGALRVEWRVWLGGGVVWTADHRERGWRWRHWVYVAGGPAATLVGCAALYVWLRPRHAVLWSATPFDGVADVAATVLLGYNVLFLIGNLIPKWTRVGTLRARTDGYQLLHTLRYPPATVRTLLVVTWHRRVEMLWEEGQRAAAWTHLRALLAGYGEEPALAIAEGYYLDAEGDHAGAAASYARSLRSGRSNEPMRPFLIRQRFAALVRADDPAAARQCAADGLRDAPPAQRPGLLDGLASTALEGRWPAFLPDADAWSREALALEPATITLKATRGAILVELGRFDEGEAMLREVWAASASEADAALSAFYLGVAAKHHRRTDESRRWFKHARGFAVFVGKWLSDRVDAELAPAPR